MMVTGLRGSSPSTRGEPFSVMGFTVVRGRIGEIDILDDPARLRQLDLTLLTSNVVISNAEAPENEAH